jgi:SagB-type dehydrogenase family enzyme
MTPADTLFDYHRRTKHHLERYAAGPSNLDWDAQPQAFRIWQGARRFDLPRTAESIATTWAELNDARDAAPFDLANLGNLLQLTSAITAWKQYGDARWALRAHPSSGNLHPTETWVVAYWVDGLADGLYHYQARDHSVEWRASTLTAADTPGLWLGYSSIHWREAWKYGERALRYCQLDMGHVLASLAYAAALFGWRAQLVNLEHDEIAHCLGLDRVDEFAGVEPEEAEVIVALNPGEGALQPPLDWDEWSGLPSLLDPNPLYQWPAIEAAAQATRGHLPTSPSSVAATPSPLAGEGLGGGGATQTSPEKSAVHIILNRRSAQAFDGQSTMPLAIFRNLLASLLDGGSPVWTMWTAAPRVHPVLLVNRVEGIEPGLYILPRSEAGLLGLTEAMRREFKWTPADAQLPLYRLLAAKAERTARTVSCHQDIASHSAFTVMFVAEFAAPVTENPAAWRHLHWEAGMLGHCLTLEAEAAGWRGTGIGCFFDDADHEILGLADERFQVIYHYAIGMPLTDNRITTLPAYD